tara:strand:- start:282 stop:803 length:522 start_codon:yes stop_codon:yes gene_type:complete
MSIVDIINLTAGACFVIYILLWVKGRFFNVYTETPFGFKAQLIYSDSGRKSKIFTSAKFGLAAKPDFIYRLASGEFVLIEYKSRKGRVYPSDIQQVIAAIIATRSMYPISQAYIYTDTTSLAVDATSSDVELFDSIKYNFYLTKRIKEGKKVDVCYKSEYKCNTCSMKEKCYL